MEAGSGQGMAEMGTQDLETPTCSTSQKPVLTKFTVEDSSWSDGLWGKPIRCSAPYKTQLKKKKVSIDMHYPWKMAVPPNILGGDPKDRHNKLVNGQFESVSHEKYWWYH